ncbi:MAG TPA: glycosyltransferase [Bacteroidales bacterium]|nr:glycosyltransferase [Bacteroidales bacterium]
MEIKGIGLFNEGYLPILDGVTMTVKNYAHWLNRKVAPVYVATPKVPDYVDREEFPVYRYLSAPVPFRNPYRFGLPFLDIQIYDTLLKQDISVVHAHSPFSAGTLALKIARQQNVPIIATFHSKFRDNIEAHVPNKLIVDGVVKFIMEFFESVDEVWIPQAKVEETVRSYGFRGRLEVVENGIDLEIPQDIVNYRQESRKILGFKPHDRLMLYIGQHIWEKNLKFLLESLQKTGDFDFIALFAGEGYARPQMELMADELGIKEKVRFYGPIADREKLKRLFACADLFLFPSLYDTSGLVFREAAALHTPALLLENATAADVITDSFNGFLSENQVDAYAGKIRKIFSDPAKIASTGHIASQTLCRSWENVIEEVADRYRSLIMRSMK